MADEDASDGDKTELPSQQRLDDAVKEGRFAESPDLVSAIQLMLGLVLLSCFGGKVLSLQISLMRTIFTHFGDGAATQLNVERFVPALVQSILPAVIAAGLMVLGCVACGVAQIGLHFNLDWLSPKFEKLNPINGFKEILSTDSLVGLVIGIGKVVMIGWSAYAFLSRLAVEAPQWSALPPAAMAEKTVMLAFELAWRVAFLLLLLAGADYAFKRYKHEQGLRVTKEEAKLEHKQQEGDPKVKQAIRQIQRQRAQNRMMRDVPKASVVIANPTHVAIALRYEPGEGRAPVVLAKGEHLMAQRIKALAAEHGIPVLEEPPLARALLRAVDVGQEIPVEFYRAVAAILAQLYKRNTNTNTKTVGRIA